MARLCTIIIIRLLLVNHEKNSQKLQHMNIEEYVNQHMCVTIRILHIRGFF